MATAHPRARAAACARTPRQRALARDLSGEQRRQLGALGERLAAQHLERRGYRVLDRNVRTRAGEIDLIAFDGRTLAFVEVKTQLAGSRLAPSVPALARLGAAQRSRVRRAAASWLCDGTCERPAAAELRLDAIGVQLDARGRLLALDHVEGAW